MIHPILVAKITLVTGVSCEQQKVSNQNIYDKNRLTCYYCGKTRHTRESCRKLDDRPIRDQEGLKVVPKVASPYVQTVESSIAGETTSTGTNEEIQTLICLLSKFDLNSSIVASSNFVKSGICFSC